MVKAVEIAKAVKEIMNNESLGLKALQLKESARNAASIGGSCDVNIKTIIEEWKNKQVVQ